jgi:uncharacterized ubiquitin-like protein YukD
MEKPQSRALVLAFMLALTFLFSSGTAFAYSGSASVDRTLITNENCGGSAEVKVTISNDGFGGALCWYKLDTDSDWTKVTPACLARGASQTFKVDVPIKIDSSPIQNRFISVECRDYWNFLWNTCENHKEYYTSVGQYSIKSWNFQIQTDCTGYISAQNILVSTQNAINQADSSISKAEAKIEEARELGVKDQDLTETSNILNEARVVLELSKSHLKDATQWLKTNILDEARKSSSASVNASTTAKETAEKSFSKTSLVIQEFKKKMNEAQIKMNDAGSSIDRAEIMLKNARLALENVSKIKQYVEVIAELEIISPKVNISDSQSDLDQARALMLDAQKAFDSKDFDHAINISLESKNFADDSYDIAYKVYAPINTIILTLGEVSKVVVSANDEINRTDNILTKSGFLVRSMKKWDVNTSDVEIIINEGQASIDLAREALTKARNRVQLGIASESIALAIDAKDKASQPANKLERIKSTFLVKIQDALDKETREAEEKINEAETRVVEAADTYLAAQEKVFDAQDNLEKAKSSFAKGLEFAKQIADSPDIDTLTERATNAFMNIKTAEERARASIKSSEDAKAGLYNTTAAAGALVAGSLGGGLLLYRRKMKEQESEPVKQAASS